MHWLINACFVTPIIYLPQHVTITRSDYHLPSRYILLFPLTFLEPAPSTFSFVGYFLFKLDKVIFARYLRVSYWMNQNCIVFSFFFFKVPSTWLGERPLTSLPEYSALISTSRKNFEPRNLITYSFDRLSSLKYLRFKLYHTWKDADFAGSVFNINLAIYLRIWFKSLLYHCFTPSSEFWVPDLSVTVSWQHVSNRPTHKQFAWPYHYEGN